MGHVCEEYYTKNDRLLYILFYIWNEMKYPLKIDMSDSYGKNHKRTVRSII